MSSKYFFKCKYQRVTVRPHHVLGTLFSFRVSLLLKIMNQNLWIGPDSALSSLVLKGRCRWWWRWVGFPESSAGQLHLDEFPVSIKNYSHLKKDPWSFLSIRVHLKFCSSDLSYWVGFGACGFVLEALWTVCLPKQQANSVQRGWRSHAGNVRQGIIPLLAITHTWRNSGGQPFE